MEFYSIDIGFNRELLSHPSTSLAALLSQGVTVVGEIGSSVHVARNLKRGGKLEITAYDLSEHPTEISAMSVALSFSPALLQSQASPVGSYGDFSTFQINPTPAGGSTVFEDSAPRWVIQRSADVAAKSFPNSQLECGSVDPGAGRFDLVNLGHFYYTILLSVTWKDDPTVPKNFRVDPEMIVTNDPGSLPGKCD